MNKELEKDLEKDLENLAKKVQETAMKHGDIYISVSHSTGFDFTIATAFVDGFVDVSFQEPDEKS